MRFWYRAEAYAIATAHGLDPDLVIALCMTESSGQTHAFRHERGFWLRYLANKPEWDGSNPVRVSSSYGLCQVMFPRAVELGFERSDAPEHLFIPTVGLEFGCRALKDCLAWAKGDTVAALASYNGGKTADNAPGVAVKRNQAYADKVLRWLAKVQAGEVTG